MSYVKPQDVISPKTSVSHLRPVHEEKDWSAALLNFDQQPAVGIRWNGENGHPGNPQSRGLPTWFIVPDELAIPILRALLNKDLIGGGDIDPITAEKEIRKFISLHGEETLQSVDADFEGKVRGTISKMIAEGKLVAGAA